MSTAVQPRLTVLSGPSGVGKSTVAAYVREHHPQVWLSVSATTRRPRAGETQGINYWFVSHDEFAGMVERGELLEYAEFAGNYYGTPRAAVEQELARGAHVLLEIELHGAREVKAAMPGALLVFLAPPSWDELVRRLVGRGTEPAEVIARRLATAQVELAAQTEFDQVLVNDDVVGLTGAHHGDQRLAGVLEPVLHLGAFTPGSGSLHEGVGALLRSEGRECQRIPRESSGAGPEPPEPSGRTAPAATPPRRRAYAGRRRPPARPHAGPKDPGPAEGCRDCWRPAPSRGHCRTPSGHPPQ